MIEDTVTVDQAIEFLNELVKLDRDAMQLLIDQRVRCSEALADHYAVQVHGTVQAGFWAVGFLGVLNGLFGTINDGGSRTMWGKICAVYDEQSGILSGFQRTTPDQKQEPEKK